MPGFIENAALSGIPAVASLGASALQRAWALKDWRRQNAYNHPKAQVARLREAGLPLASMFSGSGGSTSSDIRGTEVDPTLGTAQGLGNYMINRLQRKDLQLKDEAIKQAQAETIIKQVEANEALDQDKFWREPLYDENGVLRLGNRRQDSLGYSLREQKAKMETLEIVSQLQRAKTQAEIDHVLQSIGLSKENQRGQRIANDINAILTSKIGDGKWDLIQSMIYKLIFR